MGVSVRREGEGWEKGKERMEERRCEKQKKYPLDSRRCRSNRLVLVGRLVAGLEAG